MATSDEREGGHVARVLRVVRVVVLVLVLVVRALRVVAAVRMRVTVVLATVHVAIRLIGHSHKIERTKVSQLRRRQHAAHARYDPRAAVDLA